MPFALLRGAAKNSTIMVYYLSLLRLLKALKGMPTGRVNKRASTR